MPRMIGAVFVAALTLGLPGGQAVAAPPAEEAPRDLVALPAVLAAAPKAVIGTGDFRVTIALPDPAKGFYRSTRFDWSGMVTEVVLGRSRFYGLWADAVAPNIRDFVDTASGVVVGPRNAATGTAEEFANRDGETVPGYNSTPVGAGFIKIGVGRLRKADDKPYDHFRSYDIIDGGQWSVHRSRITIVFRQRLAADASGYGYDYEKTVSLSPGGVMTIAHRLRNIGTKPIRTQIYTHNFARFDGAEIGPGVSVEFPAAPAGPVSDPALASLEGRTLRYSRSLGPGARVQIPPLPGDPSVPTNIFTVTGANGASITMESDGPLVRTALWSIRRTVAVEPFVAINVEPGGEQLWSWRYTYKPGQRPD